MRHIVRSLALGLALAGAQPAGAVPTYIIPQDQPSPGSNIVRPAAYSEIPFDKRYEEFTNDELKVLREDYPKLGPNDEPPFPKDGLREIATQAIRLGRRTDMRGPLELGVRVDSKGVAQGVAVYKTTDGAIAKAVALQLMKSEYKPAKCDGRPCDGEYRFNVDFDQESVLHLR